jgi:hypothetical protein
VKRLNEVLSELNAKFKKVELFGAQAIVGTSPLFSSSFCLLLRFDGSNNWI